MILLKKKKKNNVLSLIPQTPIFNTPYFIQSHYIANIWRQNLSDMFYST